MGMAAAIRFALAFAAGASLAGCSSVGDMHSKITPVEQHIFRLTDARPADTKLTQEERVGSTLVRFLLGDDRIHPPFPVMLEARLYRSKGESLRGREIVLTKAAVRVYQKTGVDRTGSPDPRAFVPPGTNPAYAGVGIALSDIIDIGFSEKRIEVELEGSLDGQVIIANNYGTYSFGSPEKEVLEMMDRTLANFIEKTH